MATLNRQPSGEPESSQAAVLNTTRNSARTIVGILWNTIRTPVARFGVPVFSSLEIR